MGKYGLRQGYGKRQGLRQGCGSGQGFVRIHTGPTYRLNVPQICISHFTNGQWLYGMVLQLFVRIVVYTLANTTQLTKSAALTDGSSSLRCFVNVERIYSLKQIFSIRNGAQQQYPTTQRPHPSLCLLSEMADRKCTHAHCRQCVKAELIIHPPHSDHHLNMPV